MATKLALRHFRICYALLLRLYPQPFRDRFAEGMAQTFHDLCRERQDAGLGLFAFALSIFPETLFAILKENITHMPELGKTMLRVALTALGLLMVPLVASRVVDGWNWQPGAFVFVYILFFATGMAYALIARQMGAWSYKAGVGLALLTGFVLGWTNMVHVSESDNPANLLYFSVLALGVAGACLARLRASGLARTLFAMAATLALITWMLPPDPHPDPARNIAVAHGVLAALFAASGLLFRHASLVGLK